MRTGTIHNESDYEVALTRISVLMDLDPEPGTDEGDELELLALQVERWEEEHYPMDLP